MHDMPDSPPSPPPTPPGPPASAAPAPTRMAAPPEKAQPAWQILLVELGVVFVVAAIAATLFTFWTPGVTRQNALYEAAPPTAVINNQEAGTVTSTPRGPILVGIVAGHWKNDSGAVCPDGLQEADVNLRVASLVQKKLADLGYQVDLLEEFDPRLDGYRAAALVSIHNDSCDFINTQASGYKVAAAMATRHPELAARLTACLRQRYGQATGLPVHSTSVTPDMTLYHAFGEIDEVTPAAIIETGFLNLDREILTKQPELVAGGIVDGILCFVRNESIVPQATGAPLEVPTGQPTEAGEPTPSPSPMP